MFMQDENNPNSLSLSSNFPGMMEVDGRKEIIHKRSALGLIHHNLVHKRSALTGKHQLCNKKQSVQIHRPITRKLAAQIAKTQQPYPQNPNSNGFEVSIFVDEECKSSKDHPVPMSLEKAEAMPEEGNHMEEIEMEDIVDLDPIVDIDSCDSKNPLAVVDYINDLYSYYKKMESFSCVPPNYMAEQSDINEKMRAILIDWLIEVHDKFDLMSETLFLTINLIDRFLAKQSVVRKKLQLVGLVAMLLACKYEEVSVPIVGDLILISDKAYSRKEILEMETLMLNTLQFNMSVPTPYVFLQRFLKAAQSDKKKLEQLSFFFTELSLVENEMLRFMPSLLAAAAIYTAHCTLYGFGEWSRTCEWHSNYSEQQLLECSKLMVSYHQRAGTGKLTGVHRKYSTSKYGFSAKSEPACFLMEKQI